MNPDPNVSKAIQEIDAPRSAEARVQFLAAVLAELDHAYRKHSSPAWGRHEFYGVLKEEVDEIWDAIKADAPTAEVLKEASQVAAMCLRYAETGDRYRGEHSLPLPCRTDMETALASLRAALTAPPQPLPEAMEVAEEMVAAWLSSSGCLLHPPQRLSLVNVANRYISTLCAQKAEAERERAAALKELERVRAVGRAVVAGYGDEHMPAVEFTRLVLALHDLTCITPPTTQEDAASILTQPKENA